MEPLLEAFLPGDAGALAQLANKRLNAVDERGGDLTLEPRAATR
jgi:hypothetical protein